METLLAIDFGTQRIGLARSYGTLAEPLHIIPNTPEVYNELQKIFLEHGITKIIVGLSENKMAMLTQEFVKELRKHTDLPIEFTDETLSSAFVHQKLRERNLGKIHHTGHIDHFAAAEFLQDYIDTNL